MASRAELYGKKWLAVSCELCANVIQSQQPYFESAERALPFF